MRKRSRSTSRAGRNRVRSPGQQRRRHGNSADRVAVTHLRLGVDSRQGDLATESFAAIKFKLMAAVARACSNGMLKTRHRSRSDRDSQGIRMMTQRQRSTRPGRNGEPPSRRCPHAASDLSRDTSNRMGRMNRTAGGRRGSSARRSTSRIGTLDSFCLDAALQPDEPRRGARQFATRRSTPHATLNAPGKSSS